MKIKIVRRFSTRIFKAVNRLLPQLDKDADLMIEDKFRSILMSGSTHFFIAETDRKEIAGMLTAVVYIIPTGTKFRIEDVVVDESYRGKGIGKDLMKGAIDYARSSGARSVDLTSRPERVAANRLYQELGFLLRETNVYRYLLK